MSAAILFSIFYHLVRPPFQSPDEYVHFCRAYQISEGNFLPLSKDHRLGGELPVCVPEYFAKFKTLTYLTPSRMPTSSFFTFEGEACNDTNRVFIDFPSTANYSLVNYLPQTFSLFILRQFKCSIAVLYFGSKLFAFLIYLLCITLAIRIIPVYKWLLVAVSLLPMNMYMMNGITGDLVTNSLSFLLIACAFKLRFIEVKKLYAFLFWILLIGILLALSKMVYTGLLALLFMIPTKQFGSWKRRAISLSILIILPLFIANLWSSAILNNYPSGKEYNPDFISNNYICEGADHRLQMEHLKAHKFHIFKVIYSSLADNPEFYLRSYVGHFSAFMDAPFPSWIYISALIVLVLFGFFEKNAFSFSWTNKIVMLGAVAISYSLLVFSQHLVWNDVGSDHISAQQGRYFAPLFPLLIMLLSHPWRRLQFNISALVAVFSLSINVYTFDFLYQRFTKEQFREKVNIECGAEQVNKQGKLLCSDKNILLDGGKYQSSLVHRHGNYSIELTPDSARSFVYHFNELKNGDLVEIYAWVKGNGAEIAIDGIGAKCYDFHIGSGELKITDPQGWKKIQMEFTMFMECEFSEISFSIINKGKEKVYVDDVIYRMRKF